jgi:arginyl-tRNA synthetase
MKEKLKIIISKAVIRAQEAGDLKSGDIPKFDIEEPRIETHGDLSTNIAMVSASIQKMAPRKIAETIVAHMEDSEKLISETQIAGPGFINFFIRSEAWHPLLKQIHENDTRFGALDIGAGQKVMVEFVSANPTGPLHVGHGRGAAVGDTIAAILSFCGYDVKKEYYINDSGRQIGTLGRSVFLRYCQILGRSILFPADCYQGEYILDLAREIKAQEGDRLLNETEDTAILFCARYAADKILAEIRQDLVDFGVRFDIWFSEQQLFDNDVVDHTLRSLRSQGVVYEKEGAEWFKTSDFGDEKDRVVTRSNGQTTYFASDIAYHQNKFDRGFERLIDVWGADHHGYIPRMTAAVEASKKDRDQFQVVLVQLVNLLRKGEPFAMSTRAGEFVTLKDVVDEVGADAARFIFLTRHHDSPLDFDLEVAKQKTNDNPVFYVQYVHARISSIFRKAADRGIAYDGWNPDAVNRLTAPEEIQLIKTLGRYPEAIRSAAQFLEPHRVTFYLMNLASGFHAYYNKHRVLVEDPILAAGRLYLVMAIQLIIRNGLNLLGVSAPESM